MLGCVEPVLPTDAEKEELIFWIYVLPAVLVSE